MSVNNRVLAVVAKEIQLHRCKQSVWEIAVLRAQMQRSTPQLEYARLRCRQLTQGAMDRAANDDTSATIHEHSEVIVGLRQRWLAGVVEVGCVFVVTLLVAVYAIQSIGLL